MTLLTETRLLGVSCDVHDCTREQRLTEPVPTFSPEADRFRAFLLCEGWVIRHGLTAWWFCPEHADRANHCVKGRYGCSPWCPVHRDGRVTTWASEDARRLAGLDNMLTRAERRKATA